ncbi:MAG: hypothetical protein ABIA76_01430 [Candidatus Diapherotrites archaeon]
MIELSNIESFKKSIEAISSFISEGNFRFSFDGLKFKATDPSQIVLVDFHMKKELFEKYDIEPTLVGIDFNGLNKIMARTNPSDKMKIDLTENEMLIELDNEVKRSFKLPLLDLSEEEVKLPNYSFDATVKINARLIKEALKDAALFSSTVVLKVEKNKFFVEAKGSSGTLLATTKSKGISIEAKQDVTSKYSLNFLQNIVKEADNESEIILELKSDTALKASYAIGKTRIEFFLAHMIL